MRDLRKAVLLLVGLGLMGCATGRYVFTHETIRDPNTSYRQYAKDHPECLLQSHQGAQIMQASYRPSVPQGNAAIAQVNINTERYPATNNGSQQFADSLRQFNADMAQANAHQTQMYIEQQRQELYFACMATRGWTRTWEENK